jgi:hypothetical protein
MSPERGSRYRTSGRTTRKLAFAGCAADCLRIILWSDDVRAAYDEVMTPGIKRRHEPPRILGDLLAAEIAEKQARSSTS